VVEVLEGEIMVVVAAVLVAIANFYLNHFLHQLHIL
jgi:hypothetical protein